MNVYMTNRILKVDYETGTVIDEFDGRLLTDNEKGLAYGEVLNGIAYSSRKNKVFISFHNIDLVNDKISSSLITQEGSSAQISPK